jgi:hypothetical protein
MKCDCHFHALPSHSNICWQVYTGTYHLLGFLHLSSQILEKKHILEQTL